MEKFIRFYNQNRNKIYIFIAIIIIGYIFLKVINGIIEEQKKEDLQNLSNNINSKLEKNEVVLNNTTSSNNIENENTTDVFFNYCKNQDQYNKAYELISDKVKETKYNSEEQFVRDFIDVFFNVPENCKKIELDSNEKIYMVETYENDILSSGNVSNVKRIFLSVILEDGKKKINITDYIKEKEIDKELFKNNVEIKINNVTYFYDYVEYEISITNNGNTVFDTNSLNNAKVLIDREEIYFNNIIDEGKLEKGDVRNLNMRLNILYRKSKKINQIIFNINNEEMKIKL